MEHVERVKNKVQRNGKLRIKEGKREYGILDFYAGFRVIIMTVANSQVNTRVLEPLPKFKIKKMNRWCAV